MKYYNIESIFNSDETPNNLLIAGQVNRLNQFVVNHILNKFKLEKLPDQNYIHIGKTTSSSQLTTITKEPPFLGSHYIITGDFSELNNNLKGKVLKLMEMNLKYLICIINISNYSEFNKLKNTHKLDHTGLVVYLYTKQPLLLMNYCRHALGLEIGNKAVKMLFKRLPYNDTLLFYVDGLKQYCQIEITPDIVRTKVPDLSYYSIMDYIENVLLAEKKTLHIHSLYDSLKIYGNKTYAEIMHHLHLLLELKRLYDNGYIMLINAYTDFTKLQDKHMISDDLAKVNYSTLKRMLEICMHITYIDLQYVVYVYTNIIPTEQNLYIISDLIKTRHTEKVLQEHLKDNYSNANVFLVDLGGNYNGNIQTLFRNKNK